MRTTWILGTVLTFLFLAACSAAVPPTLEATKPPEVTALATATKENPTPTPLPTEPPESTSTPVREAFSGEVVEDPPPTFSPNEFFTDFNLSTISYSEIITLIPKDSIPAIDNPYFVSVSEADEWLGEFEPVVYFQIGADARAYPLQILMWHEIVNDVVDGVPVAVTFCPLCNTAIAFERYFEDDILDFGTTGRLRFSNLIMYDRQSHTWWQQADGRGVVGENAGKSLTFLPAAIIGWSDFKEAYPDGLVLSQETGFTRDYGANPYEGYDDIRNAPFAYDGPATPGSLLAMERVLTIDRGDEAVAYPYNLLSELGVVNDSVAGEPVVVFWTPGANSALDQAAIAIGRDVGAANAFLPLVDGEVLIFRVDDGLIRDEMTDSTWNVLGTAVDGPLAGSQLEPVVSINHFWFSWAAFKSETRVYQ